MHADHPVELPSSASARAPTLKIVESYTSTYLRFVWTMSATAVVFYGLWAFERDGHTPGHGLPSR